MSASPASPSLSFGPQEPPQDYRIFNKRQPDGAYRPLSEFFNAPFIGHEEEVDVADLYMPEIDNVEWIEVKCFVLVTPLNKRWRQFHGYVEATFPAYGVALVRKVGSTWRELFTLDEMKLIYGAGVAEEDELANEEALASTEVEESAI